MKKALALLLLAALGTASFGCMQTDWNRTGATALIPVGADNKSHGLIPWQTDDRAANTQQTVEAATRDMFYVTTTGATTLNNVTGQDAKDWNRFIGSMSYLQGVAILATSGRPPVVDPRSGVYYQGGVNFMDDGGRRINTLYKPLPAGYPAGPFPACTNPLFQPSGNCRVNVASLTEGQFLAHPGMEVAAVAMDYATTNGFFLNGKAISPRTALNGGLAVGSAWSGGVQIQSLKFTPISRREGLAEFLNGGTLSFNALECTWTVRGQLNADGDLEMDVLSASKDGFTWQPAEALRLKLMGGLSFAVPEIAIDTTHETLASLAQFALDRGMADRPVTVGWSSIPELGISLPYEQDLFFIGDALRSFIQEGQPGGDGFGN